jgi:hypothetical protein
LAHYLYRFNLYSPEKLDKFINYGKFDLFAGLTFPHADLYHLETCLAFFFWAFSASFHSLPFIPILIIYVHCRLMTTPTRVNFRSNLMMYKRVLIFPTLFFTTHMPNALNSHMLQCSTSKPKFLEPAMTLLIPR